MNDSLNKCFSFSREELLFEIVVSASKIGRPVSYTLGPLCILGQKEWPKVSTVVVLHPNETPHPVSAYPHGNPIYFPEGGKGFNLPVFEICATHKSRTISFFPTCSLGWLARFSRIAPSRRRDGRAGREVGGVADGRGRQS
jgi:hypothetical protein